MSRTVGLIGAAFLLLVLLQPWPATGQRAGRDDAVRKRLEPAVREEIRELLPDELTEEPGQPGVTGGAIIQKPREELEEEIREPLEIDPVPNRREVYRRLVEQLRERQRRNDEPGERRGLSDFLERFGGRRPADSGDWRDRFRRPDDLRQEFLELMEAKADLMSERELREAVEEARVTVRLHKAISELEQIVRETPESRAGVRARRALEVLTGRDTTASPRETEIEVLPTEPPDEQ